MVIFPERLKELRQSEGLTQTEIANQIGISQAAYQRYETGKREPKIKTLEVFADYFQVSVDFLLGREER